MKNDFKKYEPKQYKPYWYIAQKLKFGFFLFVVGLVCYGVYKLIEWLFL